MKFIYSVMFAIIAASILIASATTMDYVMASQIQGSGNAVNVIRMQS